MSSVAHSFDFDDPALDAFLDKEVDFDYKRVPPNPCDIISVLKTTKFISLLEENFFLHTNLLNSRNIIDSPLFIPPWCLPCDRQFGLYLFFNQSSDKNFTLRRNTINAYLSVGEDSFINKLQDVFDSLPIELPDFIKPEVLIDILNMFEQFTVQERKLGFMFAGQHYFDNCTHFRVMTPLYWFERNYFVDCEIQKLLQEVLDPISGTPPPEQQDAFQREHLISDTLGVGDTRIELDWPVKETIDTSMRAGLLITLPTAFSLKQGLYGNHFNKNRCRPVLDFEVLLDTEIPLQDKGLDCFGLSALDNLSAMLLTTDLGNNGHVGIGPLVYLESQLTKYIKRPWAECFRIRGRYSLEFQLPAKERLFFIENDQEAFNSRNFDDPNQATANVVFLEQTLTNRLFPFSFSSTTGPTLIFRSTTQAIYEGEQWGGYIGFDTYARTKQHIYGINAPCSQLSKLCIGKAASPWIWQSKVLGGISCQLERPDKIVIFSLNGDKTFFNKGLGRDFTLSFNVDISF